MRAWKPFGAITMGLLLAGMVTTVNAQQGIQTQIPTLQVCNNSRIEGQARIEILSRQQSGVSGIFSVVFQPSVACDPPGTLIGGVQVEIDMSDSTIKYFESTSIEQVTSTGKHSPTAYLNGKCKSQPDIPGCRFWMTVANNGRAQQGTPDVIGFLVLAGNGQRASYGTGPVVSGDVNVAPTAN
jgi:hypothetical protein